MPTLASNHQAAQAALVTQLNTQVAQAWPLLDLHDLDDSLPDLSTVLAALVQEYGQGSATLAAEFYQAERAAAKVPGRVTIAPAVPAGLDEVTAGVKWATKDLWGPDPAPVVSSAQELVQAVTENFVMDAGRQTIIGAVKADRKAKGWAREVEPGACSFCLLLATRGAVYRSQETADFRAHPSCRCQVTPIFTAFEPTAEVRRAQQLYQSVKTTPGGPKAVRNAFRRAIEAERSH